MIKFLRGLVGVLYSGVIGAILGFISWLFLYMVYIGIHLFWYGFILEQNNKILILIVCLIGGVCIGLCEKYIGKYPKSFHMVLHEFKTTGKVEYKNLPKTTIKIFTVLWFGGTVGPEAGLSGVLGGLITYVGKFLKFGFMKEEHEKIKVNGIGRIFEIPMYGIYNFIDKKDKFTKKILYGSGILFGILTFIIFNNNDNKASFITKFGHSIIDKTSFLYIIPLFLIGLLVIIYSMFLDKVIPIIFKPLEKYKILNSIVGGAILGILAISIPYILFSGEHSLKELLGKSSSLGVGMFTAIGIFKLISTKICIQTGWIGGPIFPIMFAATAFGIASSQLLGVNIAFAVAIVMSTALAGIMQNYKITFILLLFFFSANTWIFMLLVAFLAEFIVKGAIKIRKQKLNLI